MSKTYDLIIYGASGFTGRLVAEYISQNYNQEELKWAIAGRNQSKLKAVAEEHGFDDIPIVVADSQDREALSELVQSTKVVCTTVGPYAMYGSLLVELCVEHGTHYCDLTGEVQWMRRMIDAHHDQAMANQVKIVHTCGFDSIPSDMGVYFFQQAAKKKLGKYLSDIKFRLKAAKGGMSGGTIASLNNVLAEAQEDKSIYKILNNPYGLNPEGEMSGPDHPDLSRVVHDEATGAYIGPFIMASINTKVVRRSNALAGYPYTKDFRYEEAMMTGKGFSGKMKGYGLLAMLGLMMAGKPGSLMSKAVNKFLPDPGEGPSKEERESGFFNILLIGTTADGKILKAKVKGDRDPGYGSTSKMLAESAICLALDSDELPASYGVLTPSVAMGDHLLHRLEQNAGLSFELI